MVPTLTASGEDEVVCDFVATTDFDALLFGAPKVLVNLDLHAELPDGGGGIHVALQLITEGLLNPFMGCLEGSVSHILEITLERVVQVDLRNFLQELPVLLPLQTAFPDSCLAFDLSLCSITTYSDHIEALVRGTVIDTSRPDLVYLPLPDSLPDKEPARIEGHMVSLALDEWSLNSAAWMIEQTETSLFELSINEQWPELKNALDYAWPDQDLHIAFKLDGVPQVRFTGGRGPGGEIEVVAPVGLQIINFANNQKIASAKITAVARVSAFVKNQKVEVTLNDLEVPPWILDAGLCKTIWKQKCVFPFRYEGKLHTECTTAGTKVHRWWCATDVDDEGNFIDGKWGTCDATCVIVGSFVKKQVENLLIDFLEEYVKEYAVFDLSQPIGDVVQLYDTDLQVGDGYVGAWTSVELFFESFMSRKKIISNLTQDLLHQVGNTMGSIFE